MENDLGPQPIPTVIRYIRVNNNIKIHNDSSSPTTSHSTRSSSSPISTPKPLPSPTHDFSSTTALPSPSQQDQDKENKHQHKPSRLHIRPLVSQLLHNYKAYLTSPSALSSTSKRKSSTSTTSTSTSSHSNHNQHRHTTHLGSKGKILPDWTDETAQTAPCAHLQRPTGYFRRRESRAAVIEEMKCEGLLGGGTGGGGGGRDRKRQKKNKVNEPDLEKPLPLLVPSKTRRQSRVEPWEEGAEKGWPLRNTLIYR